MSVAALLAALPAPPAQAGSTKVTALPGGQVETVLGKTPLSTLEAGALGKVLSALPGLSAVPSATREAGLTHTIEALAGKHDTLAQLLSDEEAATTLDGKLEEALGLGVLGVLLGGGNLVTKLKTALEASSPTAVLNELLGKAAKPEQLAAQVLGAIEPAAVSGLLGTTLTGEPFTALNVGEVAASLGKTTKGLAEALAVNPATLEGSALALTAPLTGGSKLALLKGTEHLTLGLLEKLEEPPGGGGGKGGGTGGPGGSSTGGSTVLVVGGSQTAASVGSAGHGTAAAGKLKILSHRVRRFAATIVVQVPSAGRLSARGRGVRAVRREASRAERVTLHLALTRAGLTALRRHRLHGSVVAVAVSFAPTSGAASSATVRLAFR